MKIICITVNDDNYTPMGGLYGGAATAQATPRLPRARQHFLDRGVDAQFFHGIHAPKLGVETTLTYEVDHPGSGFKIGAKPTGCWLSHRAVWAACLLLPDDMFLILEEDAKFPENWRGRMDQALRDADDFDMLFIGSCCTNGKPKRHVAGDVYEVHPLCTHGYIVRRSALPTLIRTQDAARLYAPIDISLAFHSFPALKTRVVLPRILDQFDTEIQP